MDSDELDLLLKTDEYCRHYYGGTRAIDQIQIPLEPMKQYIVNLDTCKCAFHLHYSHE